MTNYTVELCKVSPELQHWAKISEVLGSDFIDEINTVEKKNYKIKSLEDDQFMEAIKELALKKQNE